MGTESDGSQNWIEHLQSFVTPLLRLQRVVRALVVGLKERKNDRERQYSTHCFMRYFISK